MYHCGAGTELRFPGRSSSLLKSKVGHFFKIVLRLLYPIPRFKGIIVEDEKLKEAALCCVCSDHQQLAKLIQESPTVELKDNLECELEALVGRMEAKANQITKVRKYQAQVTPSPHLLVMINFLPWSLLIDDAKVCLLVQAIFEEQSVCVTGFNKEVLILT